MKYKILIALLIAASYSFAQESTYSRIKKLFDDFEYEKVLQISNDVATQNDINDSLKVDVYLMRAVSFFYFQNEDQTKKSFVSILELKNSFMLDPDLYNPRFYDLFDQVKREFARPPDNEIAMQDSLSKIPQFIYDQQKLFKQAAVKNILVPGWGQLTINQSIKGWILTTLSTVNLGLMTYYSLETNKKEDAYLKETNKSLISQKYSDYNSSYKSRNLFIVSYLAIWLYSQLDLHFIGNSLSETESINTTAISTGISELSFSLRIPF